MRGTGEVRTIYEDLRSVHAAVTATVGAVTVSDHPALDGMAVPVRIAACVGGCCE